MFESTVVQGNEEEDSTLHTGLRCEEITAGRWIRVAGQGDSASAFETYRGSFCVFAPLGLCVKFLPQSKLSRRDAKKQRRKEAKKPTDTNV